MQTATPSPQRIPSENSMPPRKHVDELTGLRGLAALCVMVNHLMVLFPPTKGTFLWPLLKQSGILGMSLFFTLSGFVIFYNYGQRIVRAPREGIKNFCIGRFARLFPLYIVFLGGFFVFNALFTAQDLNELSACAITLPLWLLGMQSWFYGFVNDIPVVFLQGRASLLWSVSTELALYCSFIPLCWIFARITKVWQIGVCMALIAAFHAAFLHLVWSDGIVSAYINEQFSIYKNFTPWKWFIYYSPPGRLFEFAMGCLAAVVYLNGQQSAKTIAVFRWLSWITLSGVIFFWVYPLQDEWAFVIQPLFVVAFVCCVAQCGSSLLRSAPLLYMGEISYSTYLLHAIWLQFLQYSGESTWVRGIVLATYVAGTYALAHLAYTRLEMPARLWVRSRLAAGHSGTR